jgi:hypothetical protein
MADTLVPLFSTVVGVLIIIWQLNRQHKDNLRLQLNNHKEELKLAVHKQISEDVRDAMEKWRAIQVLINSLILQYHNCLLCQQSRGSTSAKLHTTVTDLQRAHRDAIHSITNLMCRLEECEIVDTNIKIFRLAFYSVVQITEEAYGRFLHAIFAYLPCDVPKERQEQLGVDINDSKSPTREDLQAIEESHGYYSAALVECYCFISDLSRELQNVLLGDLFGNRVPPRETAGSNWIVVTTRQEEVARLTTYFTQKDVTGLTQHQKDVMLHTQLIKESEHNVPTG